MKRERYKGRIIDARSTPLQTRGHNAWGMIEAHLGDHVDVEEFQAPGIFSTEDEAIEKSLAHGRSLIDAKVR